MGGTGAGSNRKVLDGAPTAAPAEASGRLDASFQRRQTALNALWAALLFGLSIATGLWFTPFLVRHIGAESYGIIMLSLTLVSYASPLVQTMSSALVLQIARANALGDPEALQGVLDASVRLMLRLSAVLVVALLPLSFVGPRLLQLAPHFWAEATGILFLTGLGFVAWVAAIPFSAVIYAGNRLDYLNLAQLLQTLARVLGAAALLLWVTHSALAVPSAGLAGAAVSFCVLWAASAVMSSLRLRLRGPSKMQNLSFGETEVGLLAYSVALVMFLGSELVIINYMADELGTGRYAAVIQIPVLLRSAMFSVSGIFGPRIIKHAAEGDSAGAGERGASAMSALGMFAALPAGVALGAAPLILQIWLGPAFVDLANALRASMVGTVILAAALPLYTMEFAAHRATFPALLRAAQMALFFFLSVILFKTTTLGLPSVALAFAIETAVVELCVTAPFVARRYRLSPPTLLKPFLPTAFGLALAWGLTLVLLGGFMPNSLLSLIMFCAIVAIVYGVAMTLLFARSELRDGIAAVRQQLSSRAR